MSNYFVNKIDNMDRAKLFKEFVFKNYSDEFTKSIMGSVVLDRNDVADFDDINDIDKIDRVPNSYLIDSTTENAVFAVNGNITVLNFASFKHPGGMFLKGSMAQEESLCHSSTLYPVLWNHEREFYTYNRYYCSTLCKTSVKHLYLDRLIYSPEILFFNPTNTQDTKLASVVTCAAPNNNAYKKSIQHSDSLNSQFLDKRIKFIFESLYQLHTQNIVSDNYPGSNSLILGAFGCGVFQQDPYEVANIFKRYISMGYCNEFDNVIFAIPSKFKNDFEAFKSVFS